ncbi:HAD-IA family hydrolase, partial [Pantoea sp. SIMBA_072]
MKPLILVAAAAAFAGMFAAVGTAYAAGSTPDPEPLILACKTLNLDPASVLFVGDDLRDIESGRDAGTRT